MVPEKPVAYYRGAPVLTDRPLCTTGYLPMPVNPAAVKNLQATVSVEKTGTSECQTGTASRSA